MRPKDELTNETLGQAFFWLSGLAKNTKEMVKSSDVDSRFCGWREWSGWNELLIGSKSQALYASLLLLQSHYNSMFVEQSSELNVLRPFLIVIIANSRSCPFELKKLEMHQIRKNLFLASYLSQPGNRSLFRGSGSNSAFVN